MIEKFSNLVEDQLSELLKFADEQNLGLRFVGGATRDTFLFEKLPKDIDIEIFFKNELDFDINWANLENNLNKKFKIEHKPFNIITFKCGDFDIEFTPIRSEIFNNNKDHKNFEAKFYSFLSAADSFKRRDFTLNVIGVEYFSKHWLMADPFNGLEDLKNKTLKACDGASFTKDPVRFLRAFRFKTAFNLEFHPDLHLMLKAIDMGQLSIVNFFYEFSKSQDYKFFLNHCLSQFNFLIWFRSIGFLSAKEHLYENLNKYVKKIISLDRPIEYSLILTFNLDQEKINQKLQLPQNINYLLGNFDLLVKELLNSLSKFYGEIEFESIISDPNFIKFNEIVTHFTRNSWLIELIDNIEIKNFLNNFSTYTFKNTVAEMKPENIKYLKLFKYLQNNL